MQLQIDTLNENFSQYREWQETQRKDDKKERQVIFAKLDEASKQSTDILLQVTKTNGRVNQLETDRNRQDESIKSLEKEQKSTLTFKGKVGVVTGIVIVVITALLTAFAKNLL